MSGEHSSDRRDHNQSMSWENQTWALLNSGSDADEKSSKKEIVPSSSGSPTAEGMEEPRRKPVGKKRERGSNDEDGKPESDHEMHIWTERERRKKMRNMFANLHALLPQLPAKADKSTIVDEAVNYIKTLQQTLQKLQRQKHERFQNNVVSSAFRKPPSESSSREAFLADQGSSNDLPAVFISNGSSVIPAAGHHFPAAVFQTWTSSNVVLSVCGGEAQISVCSEKKAGVFAAICYVLEKHKIEVVSAHVSSDFNRSMFMIQAHANRGRCEELGERLVVEDTFKQAAGEIIFWLSS